MSASLTVPELPAGPSLRLRPWRTADAGLVEDASTDPYIPTITTVPAVYSPAAGQAFVERQWGRASSGRGYPFVVARASDDHPVGFVGLWRDAPEEGRASLGYWVAPSARGQGVAAAALRAVSRWALRETGDLHRLELYIEPWNTASWHTAEKVGYRREGLLRAYQVVAGTRRDMLLYSLLRGD
ncbi:GNAT family N-acetyltransferase [Streptomyces sp. NPDC059740]|uniref:GNAT family N-acetyltransferase n=1 Tax=Streptomyces sp. NPDC059740 TaxID=3346926 RepID=UPI003667B43D